MRRYVTAACVLAMILATCQAYVLEDVYADLPLHIEDLASGGLVKILEKFRQILKTGNSSLGIPVLDPLQVKHLDLNLKKEGLIELQGTLDNLRARGLSEYVVEKGDLQIIGLLAKVSLSWNTIDLMTRYKVTKGKLADTLDFYGEGTIAAHVEGLQIGVDMKLGMQDGTLYAKDLVLHAHLKKLDFKITGLFNDVEMSKLATKIISDVVPGMLEDYQSQVSKMGSPIVKDVLNKVLKKLSISDILG